jgi:hypothetical protein
MSSVAFSVMFRWPITPNNEGENERFDCVREDCGLGKKLKETVLDSVSSPIAKRVYNMALLRQPGAEPLLAFVTNFEAQSGVPDDSIVLCTPQVRS